MPTAGWLGRLVLAPGVMLFVGRGGDAAAHAHHAVQLVWALEEDVEVDADAPATARVVVIPGGARHALRARGPIVMLLVERHAATGLALQHRAQAGDLDDVAAALERLGAPRVDASSADLAAWALRAVRELAGEPAAPPLTPPVRRVVEAVERGEVDDLATAAALARLSPSRLTHRFTDEVGLPFRRFVLWARLERAVVAVRDGADLTRAAVDAGFSDAAHFSRTFRETIGLGPSRVLPFVEIAGSP